MITTLTGPNSFRLVEELHKRTKEFASKYSDLAVERLDGEEATIDHIQGSLESQPFLSARKLVIIRSPSTNKDFTERLQQLIDHISETTDVILLEPKLDKRLSYYKQLKKLTDFQEFSQLSVDELPTWLIDQAKAKQGKLSTADARYLVDRVGDNQQLLGNELDKLLSYNPLVTRDSIDLLTEKTPQSSIFQLLDAVFSGNSKRAIELYEEQRRLRVEPLTIMGMIAWQLHVLAIVKAAGDKAQTEISREAKISPYVIQKTSVIAQEMSMKELRQLVTRVADLDAALKSTNIDPDQAIQQLLIDLTTVN